MKFQHITADLFDGEHPNPRHVVGVVYDPVSRTARVVNNYAAPWEGDPVAKEGQYLVFTPGHVTDGVPIFPKWHASDMHPGTPNVCLMPQWAWCLLSDKEIHDIKIKADIVATTQAGFLAVKQCRLDKRLEGLSYVADSRTCDYKYDYAVLLASLTATHIVAWEALHGEGL